MNDRPAVNVEMDRVEIDYLDSQMNVEGEGSIPELVEDIFEGSFPILQFRKFLEFLQEVNEKYEGR